MESAFFRIFRLFGEVSEIYSFAVLTRSNSDTSPTRLKIPYSRAFHEVISILFIHSFILIHLFWSILSFMHAFLLFTVSIFFSFLIRSFPVFSPLFRSSFLSFSCYVKYRFISRSVLAIANFKKWNGSVQREYSCSGYSNCGNTRWHPWHPLFCGR